jgi:hypothetical protein
METKQTETIQSVDLTKRIRYQRDYLLLDLRRHFNNDGISYDALKCDGDFDSHGASFPAEELPPSTHQIEVDRIPFYFPSKEDGMLNNMVLSGQTIAIKEGRYQRLYALGCVDGQNGEVYEEELTLSLADGSYVPVYVGLSNWLLGAKYKERLAFQCSHLHVPDLGQSISPGRNADPADHYGHSDASFFSNAWVEEGMQDKISKGIWEPKIWLQSVVLPIDQNIIGITFMDNLNFHIFALTLEEANLS